MAGSQKKSLKQRQSSFLDLLRKRVASQSSTSRKTFRNSSTSMSICRKVHILREFLEENGGIGKHHETPPEDFKTEVQEEKQKRLAFLKFGREGMKSSRKYQDWLTQDCSLFSKTEQNIDGEKKRDFEDTNNQILLTRERSSGRNIFDAEKTVISKHQDGSIKKSVIKETFAKVTVRKRHQNDETNGKVNHITGAAEIKRAKAVDNILNQTSEHDKKTKASLVAKIIDKEGLEFEIRNS